MAEKPRVGKAGIIRKTRSCSGKAKLVWKPTRLYALPARFSARSCTTAHGRSPDTGSVSPTGLSAPNRNESRPVRATSSTG